MATATMNGVVHVNGSLSVWKNIAMFLAGVVMSLLVMWGTYVRNAVSREEMEKYVNERVSSLDAQIRELNKNVIALEQQTAALQGELAASGVKR